MDQDPCDCGLDDAGQNAEQKAKQNAGQNTEESTEKNAGQTDGAMEEDMALSMPDFNKAFLNSILDNAKIGLFILDLEANYVYINKACGNLVGHNPAEWLGKRAGTYTHPDDKDKTAACFIMAIQGDTSSCIARIQGSDGEYRNLNIITSPIPNGEEPRVLCQVIDVGKQQEMEKALRESEQIYRSLIETSPDSIALLDVEGRIMVLNDNGIKAPLFEGVQTVIGRCISDVLPPEMCQFIQEAFQVALDGEPIEVDFPMQDSDGNKVIVESRLMPVKQEDGTINHIMMVSRDITRRRRSEEELLKSQERYYSLFHFSNDAIFIHDTQGNILDFNQKALELFGYTREELANMSLHDIHPSDMSESVQHQLDAISTDGFVSFEMDFLKKNKELFPGEINASLIHIGDEVLVQGIIRDHSIRKKAEGEIRESELKYRNLVERANDTIIIIQDQKVVYINPQGLRLSGYSRDELTGRDFLDHIVPEEKIKLIQRYQKRMKGESIPPIYETKMINKSGQTIQVEINAALITFDGKPADMIIVRDLTERKKAEKALRDSEEKYRKLIEAANDAILIADADTGLFIDANKKAESLLGRPRDEIIGMHQTQVHPSEKIEQYKLIFEDHIKKGESISEDIHVLSKDGMHIPVEISSSVFELDGRLVNQGIFHDMTERKKAEAKILESEKRFQQVADSAGEWIWEVDVDGLYTYSSSAMKTLLGYESDEVVGKKYFYDLFKEERRDEMKEMAFEVFSTKKAFKNFINLNVHKDGHTVILDTSGVPVIGPDGELVGYRGVDADVTFRLQSELRIKKQIQWLRHLQSVSREINLTMDVETILDMVCKGVNDILGFQMVWIGTVMEDSFNVTPVASAGVAHPYLDSLEITWDDSPNGMTPTGLAIKSGSPIIWRDILKNEDFHLLHDVAREQGFNSIASFALMSAKNMLGVLNVHSDRPDAFDEDEVTILRTLAAQASVSLENAYMYKQQKDSADALETMINDRTQQLYDKNKELESFAYSVSHDLKSPLRAMEGFSQALMDDFASSLPEEANMYLVRIRKNAKQMDTLINDLLTYSRLGRGGLTTMRFDPNVTVRDCITDLDPLILESRANVRLVGELPPLRGDPSTLHQIYMNLIENAIKFRREGLIPEITLGHDIVDGETVFWVNDNGIGIDPKYQDKVFQVFQRLHTEDEFPGTGIGLSLVKKAVALHGGRVWVESKPGTGTKVLFTLEAKI